MPVAVEVGEQAAVVLVLQMRLGFDGTGKFAVSIIFAFPESLLWPVADRGGKTAQGRPLGKSAGEEFVASPLDRGFARIHFSRQEDGNRQKIAMRCRACKAVPSECSPVARTMPFSGDVQAARVGIVISLYLKALKLTTAAA